MTLDDIKAIEESIEHWWQNIQLVMLYYAAKIPVDEWYNIEIDWKTCPLCLIYTPIVKYRTTNCASCPITKFDNKSSCNSQKNPWSKVASKLSHPFSTEYTIMTAERYRQLYLAVKAEICFLYDLLEFTKKRIQNPKVICTNEKCSHKFTDNEKQCSHLKPHKKAAACVTRCYNGTTCSSI